jgi:transposase
MDITTPSLASIGIDIGKEVFHIVGLGSNGKIAFRRKIKRLALAETFKKLPPCVVGMEACLSAHFVSRALRQRGHEPKIIPAIYVKLFVKGQKNDYNDAEAIAEASLRPNLRSVREKTQDQLDLRPATGFARVWSRGEHCQDWGDGLAQLAPGHSEEPEGRDIVTDERPDHWPL